VAVYLKLRLFGRYAPLTSKMSVPVAAGEASAYVNLSQNFGWHSGHNFASFDIAGTFLNFHRAETSSPVSTGGSVSYWLVDDVGKFIAVL
jgi:hypothetical protein